MGALASNFWNRMRDGKVAPRVMKRTTVQISALYGRRLVKTQFGSCEERTRAHTLEYDTVEYDAYLTSPVPLFRWCTVVVVSSASRGWGGNKQRTSSRARGIREEISRAGMYSNVPSSCRDARRPRHPPLQLLRVVHFESNTMLCHGFRYRRRLRVFGRSVDS